MTEWARDYFERGYAQRWGLPAPSADVRRHADGLSSLLRLSAGSRVIDIGCGHGRHALALAERGADVVGLDFSAALIHRARQLRSELRVHAGLIRGDMRRLPFRSACADAAVIMDAFGFFDTVAEDSAVLQEVARILRTGGRVVMKVVNGRSVLDDFRETERQERDGVVVSVSNALTLDPPRLTQRIRISGTRGDGEYERRQRLYRAEELSALLAGAGLVVDGVFSGPDGAEFEPAASPAIWIAGSSIRRSPLAC